MPGEKNPSHVKQGNDRPVDDVEARGLEAANEATWQGPGEELHDVRKAGGGTKGKQLGGAHSGRYAGSPANVVSNRESKPRGDDKH